MKDSVLFVILRRMRVPLITLIVVYAIAVLGFRIIPGIDDSGAPYRMDFFHAIYFVSFMGSTIGFGEIPYEFTGAQRLWTLVCIYISVIAWLYAIGKLISLLQDPLFQQSLQRLIFRRQVNSLKHDYWAIFGFGDPGHQLSRLLNERGISTVVIDKDAHRIAEMELTTYSNAHPIGLSADASDTSIIEDVIRNRRYCSGVIALTDDDEINLKVAIAVHLLQNKVDHEAQRELSYPSSVRGGFFKKRLAHKHDYEHDITIISRADNTSTVANLNSFGTEHALNPYTLFGELFKRSIEQPHAYRLRRTLTSQIGHPIPAFINPPRGHWVICGFGRFGKAAAAALKQCGCTITVIEIDNDIDELPSNYINGSGTEAATLHEAQLEECVGLVAGTDHDVNNLSIIVTAHDENENLFSIARQNESAHRALYQESPASQITSQSILLANRIFALINTPLTARFLKLAEDMDESWCSAMMDAIIEVGTYTNRDGVEESEVLTTWVLRVGDKKGRIKHHKSGSKGNKQRALEARIRTKNDVRMGRLCANTLPLMVERCDKNMLFPVAERELVQAGDRILFYSKLTDQRRIMSIIQSESELDILLESGRHAREAGKG